MPTSDWAPALGDVGAILRARTVDANGSEVGTFNTDTRPTDVQAQAQIDLAVGDVATDIGEDFAEKWWAPATRMTALGAALNIELSYFPEQVATGRSPYEHLKTLYDGGIKKLEEAVESGGEGADSLDGVGGSGMPSVFFPEDQGGLVGWGTRF